MLKIFPEKTNFDFMRWHKTAFAVSIVGMIATVFLLFSLGLNLGTDFAGGILMEIQTPKAQNVAELRKELNDLGLGSVSLQQLGDSDQVLLRIGQQEGEEGNLKAVEAVKEQVGADADYRRVEYVGPQVGKELIKKGIWAVALSSIGILLYLMFRFRWEFALCTVIALLHDALLTMGFFTVVRAEFDMATLAAVLMIAGYSINDTVVVFDRVREMMRKYRKMPLNELFNLSINTTLSRTILTGGTSIFALLALYFLGGSVIRSFVGSLIWGIIVGTYSSVFVATPLLLYLGLKEENRSRDLEK